MLNKGDTIGVFSSSYPLTAVDPEAAQNAIHYLEQCGYSVKKRKIIRKKRFLPIRHHSGTCGRIS